MGGEGGPPFVLADRRALERDRSSAVELLRVERTAAWYRSLGVLGGSMIVLGVLVGSNDALAAAIGGFVMLLATAIIGGAEKYELATVAGVSGVIWTSAGISGSLGTDPSPFVAFLTLALVGGFALATGVVGAVRLASSPG